MKTRLALPLAALLILLSLPAVSAAATDKGAARAGAGWLSRSVRAGADGQSADALVAIRAAGRLSRSAARARAAGLRRGARGYIAQGPGQAGKVILGLAASGVGNPRCAGSLDLVRAINRAGRRGRYGSTAYEQSYAMLGLRAAGHPVGRSVVRFLRSARGSGGWDFRLRRAKDDVSATALVILASRAAGVSRRDRALRAGLSWMRRQRVANGGFGLAVARSEANSTALALLAERAMGRRDPAAARALKRLQRSDGAFQFTASDQGSRVLASNDAVLALSGRTPPVGRHARPAGGC